MEYRKIGTLKEIWIFIKKHLQLFIYIFIFIVLVSTAVGVIFGEKSCKSRDTIETVEAKYFMNEEVIVHENYSIIVYYAKTVDSISYLKSQDDTECTTLSGNYIEINLDVTKLPDSTKDDHELDANDFKLRDHNGVYIPLSDILAIVDINALDIQINTDENGQIISDVDFSNKKAVKDYTWINTTLTNGQTVNLTLYFDMSEGYQVEKDLMLLEVDFYVGGTGTSKGEDIVLANCTRN